MNPASGQGKPEIVRPFGARLDTSLRRFWYGRKRDGNRTVRVRYVGADLVVMLGDDIGFGIASRDHDWQKLTQMLEACERLKPEIFIDVGAGLGLYGCVLGRRKAVSRIVALEPDAAKFERLNGNLKRNKLTEMADAHQVAASDKAGTGALDDMLRLDGKKIAARIGAQDNAIEVLMGAAQLFTRNTGYAQIETRGKQVAGVVTELMAAFGWKPVERGVSTVRFEKL